MDNTLPPALHEVFFSGVLGETLEGVKSELKLCYLKGY